MKIKFTDDILVTFYKSVDDSEEELLKKDSEMEVDDLGVSSSCSKSCEFHEFQCGNGDFFAIPKESFVVVNN